MAAFAAFARRDVKTLAAMCTGQVRVEGPTASIAAGGRPYIGHTDLAYYLADVGRVWDTLELEPVSFTGAGPDAVVVEGWVRAWGSGRVVNASASWLWTLRDGKVDSVRIFDTGDGAAVAAGLEGRGVSPSDDPSGD
jgi:ketosteroid isomerase-like protein